MTAEYHGVYVLSPFSNRTSLSMTLNQDAQLVIKMKNLPPPLWLTLGFHLTLVVVVLIAVGATLYALTRRRNSIPQRGTG